MTNKAIEKVQQELQRMANANTKKVYTRVLEYLGRNMYLKVSSSLSGATVSKLMNYIYYVDKDNIRKYTNINLDMSDNGVYRDFDHGLKIRIIQPLCSNIVKLSPFTYLYYTCRVDENRERRSGVVLYFIGLHRYTERHKFIKFINDYSKFKINKEKDNTDKTRYSLRIKDYGDMNICGGEIVPAKQYDDIISKHKDDIKESLENWQAKADWYKDHHLVHKYGLLLWGPPGTGKSSLSNYISTLLYRNIFVIDLSKKLEDIKKVKLDWSDVNHHVCVIEDVDLYLNLKDKSDEQKQEVENKINWLMQFLDGPGSINGMVTILTTNDKDALDPRIIRKGRIDKQFEIGYFDRNEMLQMCNRFGVDIADLNLEGKETIQPVELQSMIMEHLFIQMEAEEKERNDKDDCQQKDIETVNVVEA